MHNLLIDKRSEIILHFNKMHLQDSNVPMWVIKTKGQTYYVHHVNVDKGLGFSTKETPSNEHTKGSLKIRGKLKINEDNNNIIANIF